MPLPAPHCSGDLSWTVGFWGGREAGSSRRRRLGVQALWAPSVLLFMTHWEGRAGEACSGALSPFLPPIDFVLGRTTVQTAVLGLWLGRRLTGGNFILPSFLACLHYLPGRRDQDTLTTLLYLLGGSCQPSLYYNLVPSFLPAYYCLALCLPFSLTGPPLYLFSLFCGLLSFPHLTSTPELPPLPLSTSFCPFLPFSPLTLSSDPQTFSQPSQQDRTFRLSFSDLDMLLSRFLSFCLFARMHTSLPTYSPHH